MSESEKQSARQVFQPEQVKDSGCDVTDPTELENLNAGESTEVVIRNLVTPQDGLEASEDSDRSPKKTERPVPLEIIEQALGGIEGTDEKVDVERKPIIPESLP